jgi:lysophospholipase L1-like esterase
MPPMGFTRDQAGRALLGGTSLSALLDDPRVSTPAYVYDLDGVAAEARLNQPDGMHPNAAGVAVIVERILPAVEELIARAGGSS